jgi:hypothetical protein
MTQHLELVDLGDCIIVGHVGQDGAWFNVTDVSRFFNLPVVDFLQWPEIVDLMTELMIADGFADAGAVEQYFFGRLIRVAQGEHYYGIWLRLELAAEFLGQCSPVLRYRLQSWLGCRLIADRMQVREESGHAGALH